MESWKVQQNPASPKHHSLKKIVVAKLKLKHTDKHHMALLLGISSFFARFPQNSDLYYNSKMYNMNLMSKTVIRLNRCVRRLHIDAVKMEGVFFR